MKVQEILNESAAGKSMEDLVARLEKVGGKVYTKITKGDKEGWLGTNGKGKAKVYFAFYPDGTSQRFETLPTEKNLKAGWEADDLRDPETILADKSKADKLKKERQKEALFMSEIIIGIDELAKVCKANHVGIHRSEIEDAYVNGERDRGFKTVDGKTVATARYTVYIKNSDYTEDGKNGPEIHDPVYVLVWRDAKDPEKYHAKDVT